MKENGLQNLIHFFSSTFLSYRCNSFFHSFVKQVTSIMSDQQELIKQVLQGNVKAQKELYDVHAEIMLGVCYRYSKSMADAEDILQEGFVKVFRSKLSEDFVCLCVDFFFEIRLCIFALINLNFK